MTNSADPDQLASEEANWSWSTLFAKIRYIWVQQDQDNVKLHYENTPTEIYRKFRLLKLKICNFYSKHRLWGGSKEYPQPMLSSRNKKNNVYPCKPQFLSHLR